jgi:hypothetical protein
MTCPHLDYRSAPFADTERAYCTVVGEFVEPMRADICNDRYDLSHETDCEFYREAEGLDGEGDGS